MVPELAAVLARLLERDHHTSDDDPLFLAQDGYLDGSALRRRYKAAQKAAKLRPLRFHDLRHTFASLAARSATTTRELQEWMGHADAKTTARYTHYRSRGVRPRGSRRRSRQPLCKQKLQASEVPEAAAAFHVLQPGDAERLLRRRFGERDGRRVTH